MTYPIKNLNQLPLIIKAFRKEQGLTQAAMAEKLGISQQSYAHFEARPATASLERLFTVLRLLNVDLSVDHAASAVAPGLAAPEQQTDSRSATPRPRATQPVPSAVPSKKKEHW